MSYGIEQNVFNSPISLLLSILLCIGLFHFGYYIQKFFFKNIIFLEFKKYYIFFSPIVGIYTIIFPLFLVLIFELNFKFAIMTVSCLLILFSIFAILKIKKLLKVFKFKYNKEKIHLYLIVFLFFLLFLISASPITHADSLDYHFSGALNFLNNGHFHKEIIPMHFNLVSIGEIIIALGLTIKAEQFGSIVQFLSLLSLIPFFIEKKKDSNFLILVLICPITFFLVSSPKPQLLFCISTFLIFIFLIEKANNFRINQLKIIFPIIILILSINSLTKYSFLLSSILIGGFFLTIMIRKKLFIYSIISVLVVFTITFLPHWIFRYENFDTGFFDLVKSPLPINIYGYDNLHNLLSSGSIKILGIFFPHSLGEFSTSYGPLLILLPFMFSKKLAEYKFPVSILSLFIIFALIFGGNLPRFLYEGYLWLIYLVSKNLNQKSLSFKIFSKIIYLQIIIIIPIYLFYIINIFPGSLNQSLKENVMKKNSYGYELAQWTNKKLNKDDVLLTTHRSISLFNNLTLSSIFTQHIDHNDPRSVKYFEALKSKKINKILFFGKELDKGIFENCLGKELFYKKDVGKYVGRNPFNRKEFYDSWIYEINHHKLPSCLSGKF